MKWSTANLAECCSKIGSGATPRGGESVYQAEGISLIRSQNVYNGLFTTGGLAFIGNDHAKELAGVTVEDGDILLNITGDSVARCCQVPKSVLPARVNQHVAIIRPNPQFFDARFLLYFFISPQMQAHMLSLAGSGGTRKALTKEMVARFSIPQPALDEQKRIASILTTYDALIENNWRRMSLLEEAARKLYREWFIRLRFPGHKQFSIIDGLPQGWERVELNSIINVTHGYAFQGANFSDDPTSRILATPGNFRIGGGIKTDKLKFYSEGGPLPGDYILAPMDLIVTMTDLSKDSDTLGYPAFIPKLPDVTFLHNQRVGKVVPRGDFFPKHFLYCVLCDERYRYHIVGAATGGVIKHTSPTRILSYKLDLPLNQKLIDDFENFVTPIFLQINILIESTEKLRAARDRLLPKLMSGEISV